MTILESLKQKIPEPLKLPLRVVLNCLRSLKRIGEFRVKQVQGRLLRENYSPGIERLIVFLTPGYDVVGGGILSISSLYEESKKLKDIHNAKVILCTLPGDPPLLKYTKFRNQNFLFRFSQVMDYFQNLEYLMIHIPEYAVDRFLKNISPTEYKFKEIKNIHFNIMLQNIKLLSSIESIEKLKKIGKVTCTTAHEQYSTIEMREKLGIPLHKLSVFVSPEQYDKKNYAEKENLMIISPDNHPKKKEILELILKQLPQIRIQIIKDIPYEKYKNLISVAKWALTFGEGLDGYFIETIFSGGISFAVYNSDFFTEDFKSLRTVYESYEILAQNICSDIKELDDKTVFYEYQNKQYKLCCKYYNYERYIKNLELFYRGKYTYE